MLKALTFSIYLVLVILFTEFLNVAYEEKFTILGGKLFQTFTTRSLKSFFRVFMRLSLTVLVETVLFSMSSLRQNDQQHSLSHCSIALLSDRRT